MLFIKVWAFRLYSSLKGCFTEFLSTAAKSSGQRPSNGDVINFPYELNEGRNLKTNIFITLVLSLFATAYFSAQNKLSTRFDGQSLTLGMTLRQLEKVFGTPFAKNRNQLTYIFEDATELIVTLRDEVVSSAQLKYHRPPKIEDPEMRKLTLVQMGSEENYMSRPTWFFAGKPENGLIYKITSEGLVESLTWVPPFSYGKNRPKELQALLQDFQSKNIIKL